MEQTIERFVKAQERDYEVALSEIKAGEKQSHWMWYIFPQMKGLGMSEMADYYGIADLEEAKAYLAHPVLGQRIREISGAVMAFAGVKSARRIFGEIDRLKLKSSMTLFDLVEPNGVFRDVLYAFFYGAPDKQTLRLLGVEIKKRERTEDEVAEIAFLDSLRATSVEDTRGLPFVALVKIKELRHIHKAGGKYDLATITDGKRDWRVMARAEKWAVGDKAVYVSDGAAFPDEDRFAVPGTVKNGYRKFILKGEVKIAVLEPLVKHDMFRGNPGVLFHTDGFKEQLRWKRLGELDPALLGIRRMEELEISRAERLEDIRRMEKEYRKEKKKRRKQAMRDEKMRTDLETYADEGRAPEFATITKLDKIQNLPELFEQYTDCRFEVSEKMLGVNLSVYCCHKDRNHPVHICHEGVEVAPADSNFYWQLIRRYDIDKALLSCDNDYLLEGVCIGPGIRDGHRLGIRANEFLVFDIYNITEDYTLQMADRVAFCRSLKLLHVPMVKTSDDVFARCRTLEDIRNEAGGLNYQRVQRRGLVYRSLEPDLDVWFEVINPKFSLNGVDADAG